MRALVIALCLLATPARADVAGVASVIDGDTIEVHGQRIRLHGIDAPESRQLCRLDGKPWRCGKDAANALADNIVRRPVTCEDLGRDRYKRIIARCTVAGEDINAWMVQQGLVLAYRRYSLDYVDEEADAQAARYLDQHGFRLLLPVPAAPRGGRNQDIFKRFHFFQTAGGAERDTG